MATSTAGVSTKPVMDAPPTTAAFSTSSPQRAEVLSESVGCMDG